MGTTGQAEAVLIAGPTASGKSGLALRLAERLGGTVINADALQVYADLRILTARPSAVEETRVPHLLFGTVDAAQNHSVGHWLADAERALAAAWAAGSLPILVGGTGLYFRALTQGLSDIPAVPAAVRARVRGEAAGVAVADLHARLARRDPAMAARLRPTDPQRILRALEVLEATGTSLATFQAVRASPLLPPSRFAGVFLAPDRHALGRAIDSRFDAMMAAGALAEVARLAARRLDPTLPAMRALGVPGLLACLAGTLDAGEAKAQGKLDTRRYAKRQFTFGRSQLPDLPWMAPDAAEPFLFGALGQ